MGGRDRPRRPLTAVGSPSTSRGRTTAGRRWWSVGASARSARATTPTPAWTTSWRSSPRPSSTSPATRRTTGRRSTSKRSSRRGTTPMDRRSSCSERPPVVMPSTVPTAASASTTPARPWLRRVDDPLGRPVSMRAMALLRVLVGPIVLLHLRPLLEDAWHGRLQRDVFHHPYASWYPELPRVAYVAMCGSPRGGGGDDHRARTRAATATVWLIVTYDLFLSTTNFHNNRAYLVIVLAALAVTPAGGAVGRRLVAGAPWAGGPPDRVAGVAAVVAAVRGLDGLRRSGLSKLLDHDWASGTVTWHRVVLQRARLESSVLPGWAVDVLTDRSFHTFAAKVIIATELFIALGLWWRTRNVAVWIAVCFHVTIQLTASVEVFSYLAIAALVIWSVRRPRSAARDRSARCRPATLRPRGGRARLAGPVPRRARRAGLTGARRRPRWAGARRRARRALRLQSSARHGVVRPAHAHHARACPTDRHPRGDPVSDVESTPGRPVRPIRRVSMAAGGLVLVAAVTFGVLAPPEHCPSPTTADLRASATAAVQWFVRNQHPDGTWLYEYDARNDVVADGYNFVRHAGVAMGLYQAATVGIPGALGERRPRLGVGPRPPRGTRRVDSAGRRRPGARRRDRAVCRRAGGAARPDRRDGR